VGLIVIMMWLAAISVVGLPALVLTLVIRAKSQRGRAFYVTGGLTSTASVVGQYVAVLAPFVRRGGYSWDLVVGLIFGWHLLAPLLLAGAIWAAARSVRQSALGGAIAGLVLSIPLGIALALPALLLLPSLLGLRFEP
jgi:hypothetical protein